MALQMLSTAERPCMTDSPRIAAIYARVSTEDQVKGFSIPTQVEACLSLASREGYSVPKDYRLIDEGISGSTLERPGLRKLRELVHTTSIAAIIIYDPDRLSRNLGHQLLLAEESDKAGIKLLIVSHPLEQGLEGWLFFQMRGALSEYEKAKIKERTKRGALGRAKAGYPNGGQVPLGYVYIPEPHRGRWEIDDQEAALVRRIFQMCLEGQPVRAIARQLTAEGIPTRLDRRPSSGGRKRNGSGIWTWSSVHQILKNEAYVGRAYFGRKERLTPTVCRLRNREDWIPLSVPAILAHETFEAAQGQLRTSLATTSRNRQHSYLLAGGFFRCARCGRMMSGKVTSRGQRRYRCTSRSNVLDHAQRCPKSLGAEEVEAYVWGCVEEVLKSPDVIMQEVQRKQDHAEEILDELHHTLELINTALVKCQREDERWIRAYAAEVIDLAELKAYRSNFAVQRQELLEQQQSMLSQIDSIQRGMYQVGRLIEYCARVKQHLRTLDFQEKRLVLQALDIRVTWASDHPIKIGGSIPLENEGAFLSSTANGVMRPPFSAGSNQAGGIVTCKAQTSSPVGLGWAPTS